MPPIPEGLTPARWRYIRLTTYCQPIRFIYHPPAYPADRQQIRLYERDGLDVGQFVWQVCDTCSHGIINKISLDEDWRRRGIGRRLITRALRETAGYTWTTTGQSEQARRFFPVMTTETGAAFTPSATTCSHIREHDRIPYDQRPKPVLARGI